ncbi:MAG TPA: efflux RND transporter permease subunit [bacterium]|nr:efflux RND transporter permease subunit [bacterium]HRQ69208.1 efflux RND transporter permease subunit [bacterium]
MNFPKFAVSRPVFVSIIFIIMGLFGLYSLKELPIDLMPDMEIPAISVITIYKGAGSEEVEEKVSKVIESALSSTAGMKNIYSRSMENVSTVTCEFDYGTDLSEATNKVRDLLNMSRSYLPDDVEEPLIFKFDFSMMPIMFLSVTSKKENIRFKTEEIEDALTDPIKRIPGVGSVITFNRMEKKIIISAEKQRLSAYNLTISDLVSTVQAENLSLPAGNIEIGSLDYTIRVPGEYKNIDEINETIVASTPSGLIKIKDVARVFWGAEDTRQFGLKDGEYMVFMMVQKQSGANTVEIADAVTAKLEEIKPRLPDGFKIDILLDTSDFIKKTISSLASSVLTACFFVILVVIFFLRRVKSSLIVLLSIPASMIIAFAFLYGFGFTLNMVSLMSLSLAIGMVVDNSIVALDNIMRHLDDGKNKIDAAIDGTSEVGGAILASTLTTIGIFAPLFFVGGLIGILFGQLAGVIILTLTASLLAAMLLTPMVSAKILTRETNTNYDNWFFRAGEKFLTYTEKLYTKVIVSTLKHRKKTVLAAGIIFIVSLVFIPIIGIDFMPEGDEGMIQIAFEMPLGTKIETTLATAQHIERIMKEEIPQKYLLKTFMRGGPDYSGFSQKVDDTNTATVGARLVSQDYRKENVKVFVNKIRARIVKEVPGIEKMDMQTSSGMSNLMSGGEKPVTVKLAHKDFTKINEAALRLQKELEKIPGLKDISNDSDSLKPQIEVKIDRIRASQVGLKTSMIGTAVRNAFYGNTASVYRKDGDEFEIMVKYKKADRTNIEQLKELEIKTLMGTTVKLKDVAEVKEGLTSLSVNRQNRERIVTIGARLEDNIAIGKIAVEVEKAIKNSNIPPDVEIIYGGNIQSQKETTGDLVLMLLLGIVLVYLVMAAQFESFVDPFIIIFSIPFAISGVLMGLLLTGHALSVPAFLGMIILVGIVVNNAIVLIDYTNTMKVKHNFTMDEALIYSGERRLRPILMTATTTICGMVPLAMMSGEGHETYNPMGVAVVFGLTFSTLVTLVLIPCMYSAVDSFLRKHHLRKG